MFICFGVKEKRICLLRIEMRMHSHRLGNESSVLQDMHHSLYGLCSESPEIPKANTLIQIVDKLAGPFLSWDAFCGLLHL
jgi:hypothetical protein